MMDELVQDLVSALEQASEQSKLGELWEEMVLSPLQHRRQIRRRRGRKRLHESSVYPTAHRRCWIEASESSMDEAKDYRENLSSLTASVANYSDSDDANTTDHWPCVVRSPVRSRHPSWPESDSFTESNPGQPLRRRRKVKRMTPDVRVRFQQKLHVRNNGRRRQRPTKVQHLSGSKRRSSGWMGAEKQTEGGRLMGNECWKRKMAKEHRDAADENMSDGFVPNNIYRSHHVYVMSKECFTGRTTPPFCTSFHSDRRETSSTCSSDPGLFTNDEGRQGDDEQSDWFFEGDCGVGKAVAGLLPSWDSDSSLSLESRHTSSNFLQPARQSVRGYHPRLNRLPCSAACCFRKDRRRLPRKSHNMPAFVERLRHFSQDRSQRNFWLPPVGKQDRNQLNPLCQLPVCPIDVASESSHLRCSSSLYRHRQSSFTAGDTKRRRGTEAVSITASEHQKEELKEGASNTSHLGEVGPRVPQFSPDAQPESSSLLHEDT